MHIQPYTFLQSVHSKAVELGEAGASAAEHENPTASGQRTRLTLVVAPQEKGDRQVLVSGGARPSPSYRRWFQLFTVVVGTFMAMLDAFVVNVAIPSISRGLRTSLGEVELVIASYILVYAVLLVTGGRLGDKFGHKHMFLLGVTGFSLASVCCALAPSVFWLIGARVLQGASAALLYPQALSILQVTFSGRERAVALGIYGSALPVAAVMGQVGGGLLLQANILGLTWRPAFLINIPIGILTLVAAALFLERQRAAASVRLDGAGIALVTVALLLLVVPLVSGRDAGWPWWMLLMLAASLPALALFALFEQRLAQRGGSPLVKLALFQQRTFTVGNLKDGYHFTARKEARGRGDVYWIAYRKVSGKLTHKYLGRSVDVTLARLEEVAATLAVRATQVDLPSPMTDHQKHPVQSQFIDQLLSTKFFVPVSSHALVSRPRLSTLLDEGLRRSLTLISAPAGFGKTTLLSAWVQTLPQETTRVAWVSLDEQDNDPVRFWMYVFTALDRSQPGMFSEFVTYMRTQHSPHLPSALMAFINRLEEQPAPFLLVLDDYHLMTEDAIHRSLTYLVEHLPQQLRIILVTRVDPPLPLSRLRARSQLLEVRAEQLRCTVDETRAFLQKVMNIVLEDAAIQLITSRTEGWLAGMQLVGLSLHGRTTHSSSVDLLEEVSGKQAHILDFLTEEVLRFQPGSIQTFLLRTSILSRLSAPLCDAVLQQQGSQQVLEFLERSNLFITALDRRRHWYHYHALFAEALCSRLEQTPGEEVDALYLRASQWYAEQGDTTEAVQYAINAGDWERAADLIELVAHTLIWRQGERTTVRRWLERFPPEVVRARPQLCFARASSLFLVAPPTSVEPWLDAAIAGLTKSPPPPNCTNETNGSHTPSDQDDLLGEILAFQAFVKSFSGDGRANLPQCQHIAAHLSEKHLLARGWLAGAEAQIYRSLGEVVLATQRNLEASQLMQATGHTSTATSFLDAAIYILIMRGRLHEAWQYCEQAINLGKLEGYPLWVEVGHTAVYQMDILREWNQLEHSTSTWAESIAA